MKRHINAICHYKNHVNSLILAEQETKTLNTQPKTLDRKPCLIHIARILYVCTYMRYATKKTTYT